MVLRREEEEKEEEEALLNKVCVVRKGRTVAGYVHLRVKPVPQGEALSLVPSCATGT